MKVVGMLIRRLGKGCKFRTLVDLGCSEENDIMCTSICSREGLVKGFTRRNI